MSKLSIDKIRTDGGTQSRESLDQEKVAEYAEEMQNGAEFDAVVVFHDGADYWLADGFHRVQAARKAERDTIDADVKQGTRRDAILHSVGANSKHGLPRTNADKRRAVMMLLEDAEWAEWSNREIARRCSVHNSFVDKMRKKVSLPTNGSETCPTCNESFNVPGGVWHCPECDHHYSNDNDECGNCHAPKPSAKRTYTDKHGNTSTMDTSNIGKSQKEKTTEVIDTETGEVLENVEVVTTTIEKPKIISQYTEAVRIATFVVGHLQRMEANDPNVSRAIEIVDEFWKPFKEQCNAK